MHKIRQAILFVVLAVGIGLFWHSYIASPEPAPILEDITATSSNPSPSASPSATTKPEHKTPEVLSQDPAKQKLLLSRKFQSRKPSDLNIEQIPVPEEKDLTTSSLSLPRNWKVWRNIGAAAPSQGQEAANKKLSGYTVTTSANFFSSEENFSINYPMVIYNERLKNPGIITGTIEVHLKTGAEIESVLKDYSLKIVSALPHLQLYYVVAQADPVNLRALSESLQADSRIEKIQLEIVSRSYEKK